MCVCVCVWIYCIPTCVSVAESVPNVCWCACLPACCHYTSLPYQAQLWQPGPLIALHQIWHCLRWQHPDERSEIGVTMYPSLPPICFDKSTSLCSARWLHRTTQSDANHFQRPELWARAKVCGYDSNQQQDWKRHAAIKPNKMPASPY